MRVPDDLSVVGFDNIPESALAEPPLTTIEQPIQEMGHHAIEMLLQLIARRRAGRAARHAAHRARRAAVDRPRRRTRAVVRTREASTTRLPQTPARPALGRTRAARPTIASPTCSARMTLAREGRPALRRLGRRSTTPAQASRRTSTSSRPTPVDWRELIRDGLGQLTRPFGTAPVDPATGRAGAGRDAARRSSRRAGSASRRWSTRSA